MAKVLCMFIFIYLLFHVFHLPWKLGLSFNFITYDDDRKVFRFKRTQSKHYSIFLHSSDFQLKQILDIEIKKREREERQRLSWVLVFKNIVWFCIEEKCRDKRKWESILSCDFFFVSPLIYKALSHAVLIIVEPIFLLAIRIWYRSPVEPDVILLYSVTFANDYRFIECYTTICATLALAKHCVCVCMCK